MRRCALLVTVVLLFAGPSLADTKRVHGFVTAVDSPTSFAIDDYQITRDPGQALEFEKYSAVPAVAAAASTFKPQDIRIGTELEVEGNYDSSTHELKAQSVKVFLLDTVVVDRTAQLEKMPELEKNAAGAWHGIIYADGQCVVVSESTPMTVAAQLNEVNPGTAQRLEQAKAASKSGKTAKPDPKHPEPVPFTTLDQISVDTFVHYEGTVQPDGSVLATKIEFEHAGLDPDEAKLWNRMKPKLKEQDYTPSHPGHLTVAHDGHSLFPSREVQDYIASLGMSLIPEQQKNLLPGDPLKIDFRFFVVKDNLPDCLGFPNGVIVIHSGMLDVLTNEAQLAFILSDEIAGIIEKGAWRDIQYHADLIATLKGANILGMFVPFGGGLGIYAASYIALEKALRDSYGQSLDNQADRVAFELMLSRGYDIREAPEAWKALLPHLHDLQDEEWKTSDFGRRHSYLQAQLKTEYDNFDYSGLKQDSPEFQQISALLQASALSHKKD